MSKPEFVGRLEGNLEAEPLELCLDRHGFLRRQCPGCHRAFMLRAGALDGLLLYRKLSALVAHGNGDEASAPLSMRHCPYCRARADDSAWFTTSQLEWLERRAKELASELHLQALTGFAIAPSAGGFRAPVGTGRRSENRAPEEPLEEMKTIPLLCCNEELKVALGWSGALSCYYCGTEYETGSVPDRSARFSK